MAITRRNYKWFSEERKIGSGGYGVVYKGVYKNGEEIAVKKLYHMPGLDDKQFRNELQSLTRLRHQNIVRLVGKSYEEKERFGEYEGKLVCAKMIDRVICLEYLHNGSLEKHLSDESSGLPWHRRYEIIKGICDGLKYLHERGIFHLDLKPANILLDKNMVPKIADFGLSRLFSGTRQSHTTSKFLGTLGYVQPEYIEKGKISEKFDVFSLGVIIIGIMTGPDGYSEQSNMSSQNIVDQVLEKWSNRPQEQWKDASYFDVFCQLKICIEIALNCVETDRHKRPNIGDIICKLNESETMIEKSDKECSVPPIEPLDNHQLSLDDLGAIKVITKGSSGIVQLVRHKWTGQFFALKIIQLNIQESIRRQIAEELKISLSTQCQYVVVCYQCFYVSGVIYIVFENMTVGSLADFLKIANTIPEPYLAAICKQLLKGLMYLHHEKHIIHRDLKPSNILINHRGEVKISDFGVSAIIASSSAQRDTFIGTYNYMAPERISGQKHGFMSDIWSLGLVMLECATGNFPYPPRDSFYELLEAVVDQPPPSAPSDQFSLEFCSFISACMQKKATDRLSAQVLSAHPFLSMYDDLNIDLASYFTTAGSPLATFK